MDIIIAVIFILGLEALLVGLSTHPRTAKWFSILPAIFWMYFLPGVFARLGWVIVPESLAQFSSSWLMPLSLILMVAPANLPKLMKMGRQSFVTLMVVYASMIVAGFACFLLFKPLLAPDSWKAFSALAATWTGGTVNMLAIKEIVGLTESQFSVMVITDSFLSYGWMVLLILFYRWHEQFDRWCGSSMDAVPQFEPGARKPILSLTDLLWLILALGLVGLAYGIGLQMPASEAFSHKAWILLLSSLLALAAAAGGWHRIVQSRVSEQSGSWLLYFVLMTMRAQADFVPHARDFVIVGAGIVWLFMHGCIMVLYAKVFRMKFSVTAVASQAAVGGVVSAPVLAALYDKSLVSIAVLMGICGNVVGTYLALLLSRVLLSLS